MPTRRRLIAISRERARDANRRVLRGLPYVMIQAPSVRGPAAGFRIALQIHRMNRAPIVLGGCGRSGTTLMLSVLSCHPEVYAFAAETHALCPTAYTDRPDRQASLRVEELYARLIAADLSPCQTRWCEKSPRNVLFAARILDYFGSGARFIHMVRDGRDVVTSVHPDDPSTFWVAPERWADEVAVGRGLEAHPQFLSVRYEDLVGRYEPTLRRVCDFLALPFVTAFLDYPRTAVVKESAAWFGPAAPVSGASVGRWRDPRFRDRVESLLNDPRAVDHMRHYGYLDGASSDAPMSASSREERSAS